MPKPSTSQLKRRLEIAEMVRKNREIKVDDLSARLGVSGVTIRNDLNYLEQQGYLKRSFGGAIYTTPNDLPHNATQSGGLPGGNRAVEIELARQCAQRIEDGDVLFLGHGELTRKMLPFLAPLKNLTLLINDLSHAQAALDFINGKVILAGGNLNPATKALHGDLLLAALDACPITVSVTAIDTIAGGAELMLYDETWAATYRAVMACASRRIVLLPKRMAEQAGAFPVGRLDDISCMIAPQDVIAEYHQPLVANGLLNRYTNNECFTYIHAALNAKD
ncbi:DeoR/GlpR family DNA-binding transcription regulator [Sodalis sp. RH21]|uniref:DeoR/GlpR family DNA-binding transcription regulator n=1 Tax=unclassified Sodalis (in: enterobacteria) TaxID=2636512 RepID=UPI0039B4188B